MDEEGNVRENFAARFRKAFNAAFSVMVQRYVRGVIWFVRHRFVAWGMLAAAVVLLVVLMKNTQTGLVPDEDTAPVVKRIFSLCAAGNGPKREASFTMRFATCPASIISTIFFHAGRSKFVPE